MLYDTLQVPCFISRQNNGQCDAVGVSVRYESEHAFVHLCSVCDEREWPRFKELGWRRVSVSGIERLEATSMQHDMIGVKRSEDLDDAEKELADAINSNGKAMAASGLLIKVKRHGLDPAFADSAVVGPLELEALAEQFKSIISAGAFEAIQNARREASQRRKR